MTGKPEPTETPLLVRARAVATYPKYVGVAGAIEDLASRAALATARGRFFPQ